MERNAAWVIGLVAGGVYFFFFRGLQVSLGIRDTLSATVNIAAIGVGFLLTANSILVSADDKWIIQRAKEAGAYGMLVRYLLSATKWCLTIAVASAFGLLFQPQWNLSWYPYALCFWVFLSGGAVAALVRVLLVFSEVLLGLAEE